MKFPLKLFINLCNIEFNNTSLFSYKAQRLIISRFANRYDKKEAVLIELAKLYNVYIGN